MVTISHTHFTSDLSLASILQKFGLVLTYEDYEKEQWHLLMPDCVHESLAISYSAYLDMAMKGVKVPSAKELRMMAALQRFMGGWMIRIECLLLD